VCEPISALPMQVQQAECRSLVQHAANACQRSTTPLAKLPAHAYLPAACGLKF
jgi:hypothetical protein